MNAPALDAATATAKTAALPPPEARGWLRLSPVNRRRLANFRSHQRGYWSFWIFIILFGLSLGAEVIANDRPILVVYKGEVLLPILHDYPEEKFGGFLARTDYRDAVIADEIDAHGFMVWPPIRFSYRTINRQLPTPAPSPPTWMLSKAQCDAAAERFSKTDPGGGCRAIEWNWLGTDDQGRDVLARLIYGFRLSLLFGLTLAIVSSVIGIAAGAVQGYFGGWTDLVAQRFIEIWSSLPHLYLLIIISSIITPSFFVLLGILLLFSWVNLVHVVRAECLRTRNFEYVTGGARAGARQWRDHLETCAAQRHRRHPDVPALRSERLDHDSDRAGFFRLRPAARLALAGRIAAAGQVEPSGALARPHRLRRHRADAIAARLHRRSGARRLRPAEDVAIGA